MSLKNSENQAYVVIVSCGSINEAETIAEAIVTEYLAACVNVIGKDNPIRSFYIWDGALQKENEILLLIKTTPGQLSQLETRIQELHSYTVPEFIAIPIFYGGQSYLEWIKNSVAQS